MDKRPLNQSPPSNYLSAAIKKLPKAGPNVGPQTVEIDTGPGGERYRVTFVVRENPKLMTKAWFWGVESSERIPAAEPGNEGNP